MSGMSAADMLGPATGGDPASDMMMMTYAKETYWLALGIAVLLVLAVWSHVRPWRYGIELNGQTMMLPGKVQLHPLSGRAIYHIRAPRGMMGGEAGACCGSCAAGGPCADSHASMPTPGGQAMMMPMADGSMAPMMPMADGSMAPITNSQAAPMSPPTPSPAALAAATVAPAGMPSPAALSMAAAAPDAFYGSQGRSKRGQPSGHPKPRRDSYTDAPTPSALADQVASQMQLTYASANQHPIDDGSLYGELVTQ